MSKTIVMNTLNGAVTEYDWALQSITADHGGSVNGLYLLGGDKDVDQPIAASMETGVKLRGPSLKAHLDGGGVYLSMRGAGSGTFVVLGRTQRFAYRFQVLPAGVSRAKVGRGIRENYLGFGFSNVAGAAFSIDRMEVKDVNLKNRRIP